MAREYAPAGVEFVFLYTREAHPGECYPHHTDFDRKLDHARDMVERWAIERPMLVDDLAGTVHRAYGLLPNMTWIVSRSGTVLYRANWTDARSIRGALDQLTYEREARRDGARLTPFYSESVPQRTNAVDGFMEGLSTAGPKAVEEFLAAVAATRGEAAAKPLRAWWASRRSDV